VTERPRYAHPRLYDKELWQGGPTWDLELHVPPERVVAATMALLRCGDLTGWWTRDGQGVSEAMVDAAGVERSLAEDNAWTGHIGFARVGEDRDVPCSVDAHVFRQGGADSQPGESAGTRATPADGMVRLYLPANGLRQAYPDTDVASLEALERHGTARIGWVTEMSAFFGRLATGVLSACEVNLTWFGMEEPEFVDSANLTGDDLRNPHDAIYLPEHHALANTPGGVDVSVGQGYRFWGFGVEVPESVRGCKRDIDDAGAGKVTT